MKKIILASVLAMTATSTYARTVYYPKDACAEIVSSEYSTAGGDSAIQLYEIMSKYRDWETDRKSTRLNSSHRL